MPNENCLKDVCCPSCGAEEEFQIAGTAWFIVRDDGVENTFDVDWGDPHNATICRSCLYRGLFQEFSKDTKFAKTTGAFSHSVPATKEETDELTSDDEEPESN